MKILFVITKYYPKIGGTPNCTRNIINRIKSDHEVHILTTKDAVGDKLLNTCEGVPVYKVLSYNNIALSDIFHDKRSGFIKRMSALIGKVLCRVFRCEDRVLKRRFTKQIRSLNKNHHFDWVVAVGGDICPAEAVLRCREELKRTCFYQLDPYTTNKTLPSETAPKRCELEKRIYNSFDLVFTTQFIKNELSERFEIRENVHTCNFPNITDRTMDGSNSPNDNISCLFCGAVYSARNVDFCLDVMKRVAQKDSRIRFDFYVLGSTDAIRRASAECPQIRVFDPVSPNEIFDVMNSHDILINIGNVMTNQIPSKIYDYISTGLPILNFIYNDNCPTLDVFGNYPLSLSVSLSDDLSEASARAHRFITENAGKREDYSLINRNFYENTIDCVADKILSNMQRMMQ